MVVMRNSTTNVHLELRTQIPALIVSFAVSKREIGRLSLWREVLLVESLFVSNYLFELFSTVMQTIVKMMAQEMDVQLLMLPLIVS